MENCTDDNEDFDSGVSFNETINASLDLLDDNPSDEESCLFLNDLSNALEDDEGETLDDFDEELMSFNVLDKSSFVAVSESIVTSNTKTTTFSGNTAPASITNSLGYSGIVNEDSTRKKQEQSKHPRKEKKKRNLIKFNPIIRKTTIEDPFGLGNTLALDANVSDAFPKSVRFRGDLNAVFLVIIDAPSAEDADDKINIIDFKQKIIGPIRKAVDEFYTEIFTYPDSKPKRQNQHDYSIAMVSTCMGWHGDKFRITPTAPEIAASAPYLKQIITNMHNLRFIFVVGKYSEELLIHHLCPYRMYMKPKGCSFHKHDQPSQTMERRNTSYGKISHVYLEDKSHRYLNLPYPSDKRFNWMITDSLFKLENKKQPLINYPVSKIPYDIRTPPVNMECNPNDFYTFDSFKNHLHKDMKFLYGHRRRQTVSRRKMNGLFLGDDDECSLLGVPSPPSSYNIPPHSSSSSSFIQSSLSDSSSLSMTNTYDRITDEEGLHLRHPTALFRDVSLEPYLSTDTYSERLVCMKTTKYDHVNNVLNMYCHTPSGNPILVSIKDAVFTFWIRPHVNFAETDTLWASDETKLQDEHLNHLRTLLKKKLHYVVKDRKHTITAKDGTVHEPFQLSFAHGYHDYKEGYWHNKEFVFIQVDVRNYAFIQPIVNQLKKLISGQTTRKKEKFITYQIYSPEHMLTYKYNWLVSHWFKIRGLSICPPQSIAPQEDLHHARVLYSEFSMEDRLGSIGVLDPAANIPIGNTGLTSSDMPPSIRAAFDIETWYERGVKDHDNTPIICICMAVRKHHPLTSKFDSETKKDANGDEVAPFPTFVPLDGYVYYTFMMGDATPPTAASNHLGPEFIFSFMREDDLIRSFYLLRRLLLPDYLETHNGKSFDDPKIYNRAIMLGIDFDSLGFREDESTRLVYSVFQSKAHGERKQWFFEGHEGIVYVDTLLVAFRELKRRSYKLNSLAYDYAGKMTKHDMPYDAIKGHWITSPETRRKLIDYCIRDSQLPDQIINCRQTIPTICELARVTGNVSEDKIHEKGMQEKVLGAMMQTNYAMGGKVLIPSTKHWMKQHNEDVENYYFKKLEKEIQERLFSNDGEIKSRNDQNSKTNTDNDDTVIASIELQKNTEKNITASLSSSTAKKQRTTTMPYSSSKSPTSRNWFVPSSVEEVHLNYASTDVSINPMVYGKDQKSNAKIPLGRGSALVRDLFRKTHQTKTRLDKKRDRPPDDFKAGNDEITDAKTSSFFMGKSVMGEKRKEVQKELSKANSANNALTKKADYAGAVVMKVKLGWQRKRPLGCVDFASLYPSIIMANNLDSNTKVFEDEMELRGVTMDMLYPPPSDLKVMNPRTKKYVKVYCIKPEYRKGLLVETENMLVAKRAVAKKLIPKYQNQFLDDGVTINPDYDKNKADVMEQRSNGLKLIGNSGYGVKGTETDVGDKHIAAMVTAYGRDYITLTRSTVEKLWHAICRGGDTDSIFMEFAGNDEGDFRFDTVEELEAFADEWVKVLNKLFRYPVKIDYEKAMENFTAVSKKRYIYWLCLKGKKPKLTYKGLETVRRDSLPFTKDTMEKLFKILQELSKEDLKTPIQDIRKKYKDKIEDLTSRVFEMLKTIYGDGGSDPEVLEKIFQDLRVKVRTEEGAQFIPDPNLYSLLMELRQTKIQMTQEIETFRNQKIDAWTASRKKIAIDFIKEQARKLLSGEVPISDLILSKGVSREYYANQKQEHLTVIKKLEERGLPAPGMGDRVCFVYTKMPMDPETRKPRLGYEIADDPEWVVKNEIPIDYVYYLEHKFIKPVVSVLKYFLMEDMVERIAAREEKINVIDRPIKRDITMKDIAKETEEFLFHSVKKKDFCNPTGKRRYFDITGYKVTAVKADTSNRSSIASFLSNKTPSLKSHMKKHSIVNKKEGKRHLRIEYEEKIKHAREIHAQAKQNMDSIHAQCRSCLQIKETEPVVCSNTDCLEYYWKRIALEGQEASKGKQVEELEEEFRKLVVIGDIEDLF
jgi:DNA polymerase elongation subunit (family B)